MRTFTELQDAHFDWLKSVGWTGNGTNLEKLMLVVSECGEAANEVRGDIPTSNFPTELADIVLRVMGIASENGINLEAAIAAKMEANKLKGTRGRLK